MRVQLIACTRFTTFAAEKRAQAGYVEHPAPPSGTSFIPIPHADELAEFAGRLCYQSWDRPNPATATNDGYLANILAQKHFSVLEHASASFYVDGVSRSLSHELVRHRHLSFSQVSQRYVDSADVAMVRPPALEANVNTADDNAWILRDIMDQAREAYAKITESLIIAGLPRKEARQAARAVLPNATETKLIVTGNMRTWREVIEKRNSPHADAEIRQLAAEILRQLKEIAPGTFQDMT